MIQLKDKINNELYFLNTLPKDKSVLIKVENDIEMYIDTEILIKEKESELKNITIYEDGLQKELTEITDIENQLLHLNKCKEDEIIMYHNGVPFNFNRNDLIFKLTKERDKKYKYIEEINEYFKTGKQSY